MCSRCFDFLFILNGMKVQWECWATELPAMKWLPRLRFWCQAMIFTRMEIFTSLAPIPWHGKWIGLREFLLFEPGNNNKNSAATLRALKAISSPIDTSRFAANGVLIGITNSFSTNCSLAHIGIGSPSTLCKVGVSIIAFYSTFDFALNYNNYHSFKFFDVKLRKVMCN